MKITRVYVKGNRYYYSEDLPERNPKTGRPLQKWHKLTRVDEGEAALHAALAEFKKPDRVGDISTHITEFLKEHSPTLTPGVRKEYKRMFDVIGDSFREFNVQDVLPGDVLRFLNDNFGDKLTARHHYKGRLSTFFSWCVVNHHIPINPCREIKLRAPNKRISKLTPAVWWAIHDKITPMGACFMDLVYFSLQRPTEIRLLRESWIGAERIHVRPSKTERSSGEEVEILITPEIEDALKRARALRDPKRKVKPIDPFIIQTRDGDGYTKNGFYEVWRDACDAAGVAGVTTRDIVPFAMNQAEKAGVPVRKIMLARAHALQETTEGYLNQHRERLSDVRIAAPPRKT